MNKILLIAIALMAMIGTASAYTAHLYDDAGTLITTDNPIELKPGDTINVYYGATSVLSDQLGLSFDWNVNELTAHTSTGAVDGQLVITLPSTAFVPDNTDYVDSRAITLALHPDTPHGASFYFEIQAGGNVVDGITLESADASRTTVSVPEFPTIALPIAAILGLAFIFQRRKEED